MKRKDKIKKVSYRLIKEGKVIETGILLPKRNAIALVKAITEGNG